MGKIFVLSVTDHEEYILSRIMEIIAAEPGFDHIVSFHPCNTLVFPGLELRLKERTVHRNGELISMTHREFATLVYLANHPSWVFSAGQIYEEVWGEDGENCGTAVASVIGQIRRKLTPDMPKAGYIRTVLGSGYKFEVPQGIAEQRAFLIQLHHTHVTTKRFYTQSAPPQSYRLRRRFVVQHNIETIVCIRIFALVLKSRLSYN